MANNDFIISTLNISAQQIRSLSTVKKDQKFYIQVELVPEYPECPFCGGKVKIKDHSRYKYNHLLCFSVRSDRLIYLFFPEYFPSTYSFFPFTFFNLVI